MSKAKTAIDVFLYIPNIIGYLRIVVAILSFCYMPDYAVLTGITYCGSQLLDAVDGYAARHFNQCSKFGAILDQLTDRCTFLGLLFMLVKFYPKFVLLFQLVAIIDVTCHWVHLHSCLIMGKTSHKIENENSVLRIYYSNNLVLFTLCACNELFFLSLYFLYFSTNILCYKFFWALALTTAPFMLIKIGISLLQGAIACKNLTAIDANESNKKSKQEN